jgi:hypothetical protein
MVDQITYHKTKELWWIRLHTIKPRNYGGSDYIHCTIKHRNYGGSDYIPYKVRCPSGSMSLKSLDLTAHTSLSPTLLLAAASGVHPFCNLQCRTRTHAILAIGLYELLGNPTSELPNSLSHPGP